MDLRVNKYIKPLSYIQAINVPLYADVTQNPSSIKTKLTLRFPDNFLKNTLKEIKSGNITMKYKKQILKDIDILLGGKKIKDQA